MSTKTAATEAVASTVALPSAAKITAWVKKMRDEDRLLKGRPQDEFPTPQHGSWGYLGMELVGATDRREVTSAMVATIKAADVAAGGAAGAVRRAAGDNSTPTKVAKVAAPKVTKAKAPAPADVAAMLTGMTPAAIAKVMALIED